MKNMILCLLLFPMVTGSGMAFNRWDYHQLRTTGNCIDCDLKNADLQGWDLSGSDLRGSNLAGARFQKANLYKADIFATTLEGTNFSGAYWIDGTLCREFSIDHCIKKARP